MKKNKKFVIMYLRIRCKSALVKYMKRNYKFVIMYLKNQIAALFYSLTALPNWTEGGLDEVGNSRKVGWILNILNPLSLKEVIPYIIAGVAIL